MRTVPVTELPGPTVTGSVGLTTEKAALLELIALTVNGLLPEFIIEKLRLPV
jgi:hypothetical protein